MRGHYDEKIFFGERAILSFYTASTHSGQIQARPHGFEFFVVRGFNPLGMEPPDINVARRQETGRQYD
jgi:hypothetical protein